MFGCLIILLNIINILGWIIWTVIAFFTGGLGPGCTALIGCVGYLLSWGIVDGSIMSPMLYFFNPALHIWIMKASFCNAVGIGLMAIASIFLWP
ncbi:MAG: hypothetical protein J1D86_03450 [Alistipes sp.]|nr:hypothetical protein [Alistipes sp.]